MKCLKRNADNPDSTLQIPVINLSHALKFLPPELTHIAEAKQRFMHEAQAATIMDHPNICTVHEFDEAEEKIFISEVIMKHIDPLIRLVNDHEKISEFLEGVLDTRSFLHEEEAWRKIKLVEEYFQRHIIHHFEFEEKKVFPAILSNLATQESIELVLELQKEHGVILTKLREFLSITSKKIAPVDNETGAKLNSMGRKIILLLLAHASKEDDRLIPILEKNGKIFYF